MNILFVCKYNRFRSQIAEAFFNKLNKDKDVTARSAGIFKGLPIDPIVFTYAEKYGIKLNGEPKTISVNLIRNQDLIIIIADDVPKSLFTENIKFKRITIVWKITDIEESDQEGVGLIFNSIQERVKDFIENKKYL
ncbi:MAG: hypothetical protein HQ530_01935 [Parcubacteria group bacterium]|nr:hypothetical protein [Parcubacteria group bacterium]